MAADAGSDLNCIRAVEVLIPCEDLDETLAFFRERLGFVLHTIFPADDPSFAVVSGHGVRLRLQRGAEGTPGALRLLCDPDTMAKSARMLTAPNGTRVELVPLDQPMMLPPVRQSFVLNRMARSPEWTHGRAGMHYRDLIPGRQGGRFVASHIRIPDGGPVSDYVHYHKIRFQMIYCYKGRVRVCYEDQGPPFDLSPGDCVLQPPRIRHRVLECTAGLEVIEIGSPAEHETCVEHDLRLPTPVNRSERDFDGQTFVHHIAADAGWAPWRERDFECRDTGIGSATRGLASVRVVRTSGARGFPMYATDNELFFFFLLRGSALLCRDKHDPECLATGDCFVIPSGLRFGLAECSDDTELLEVSLPAETPWGPSA